MQQLFLSNMLNTLRGIKAFNEQDYLKVKLKRINEFFTHNHLDSCVLGISGGIDSALVLTLLERASKCQNSPIKKIIPLIIPICGNGTTNQFDAKTNALILCDNLKNENYIEIKLDKVFEDIKIQSSIQRHEIHDIDKLNWADGQMASVLRTPVLYYYAAILQAQGFKSIVVGTINKDEKFLGFYGKACDAMVDLQFISDLHKSEVYKIARLINIPEKILNRKPMGDVYNGQTDQEMIGASYDDVELYTLLNEYKESNPKLVFDLLRQLEDHKNDFNYWSEKAKAINNMCLKNFHKTQVGFPSHFI